jgi:hypothetical protein
MPLNIWKNSGSGSIEFGSSGIFVIEAVSRFVSKTAVIRAGSSWEMAVASHACSGKVLKASTIAAFQQFAVKPEIGSLVTQSSAHGRPSQKLNGRTEVFLSIACGGGLDPEKRGADHFPLTVALQGTGLNWENIQRSVCFRCGGDSCPQYSRLTSQFQKNVI